MVGMPRRAATRTACALIWGTRWSSVRKVPSKSVAMTSKGFTVGHNFVLTGGGGWVSVAVPSPPVPMDGRVLHEALLGSREELPAPETKRIETARDLGIYRWKQYLKTTQLGDAVYYDEAGGGAELR